MLYVGVRVGDSCRHLYAEHAALDAERARPCVPDDGLGLQCGQLPTLWLLRPARIQPVRPGGKTVHAVLYPVVAGWLAGERRFIKSPVLCCPVLCCGRCQRLYSAETMTTLQTLQTCRGCSQVLHHAIASHTLQFSS